MALTNDPSSLTPPLSGTTPDYFNYLMDQSHLFPGWLGGTIHQIYSFFIAASIPLSIVFLVGIVYCVERLKLIRRKEIEKYDLKVETAYETVAPGDQVLSQRWDAVMKHIDSDNQNDWKQAIIDADIMLDHLLTQMGYRGESVGEKLKRVQPGEFETVRDAWDAHMVRNDIAHQGSTFSLSHHDAKTTIHKYKKVFEEFYYI